MIYTAAILDVVENLPGTVQAIVLADGTLILKRGCTTITLEGWHKFQERTAHISRWGSAKIAQRIMWRWMNKETSCQS